MKTAFLAAAVASLLATAGLSALQGCSVSTGVVDNDASDLPNTGDDDDVTPDAATTTSDDAGDVNSCNQCLYDTCAAQNSACFANADCTSLYQCALSATTTAAAEACATQFPNGACLYAQLSACDNVAACSGNCSTQCAGMPVASDCSTSVDTSSCNSSTTDSGTTVTPDDAGVDSCTTCINANCSSQQSACAAGTDCDNYNKCVGTATTSAAADACATMYSAGKTSSEALATCSSMSCAAQCGS